MTSTESSTSYGPEIKVTKNLFFQDFSSTNDQDITLLGSAAISNPKGCIQIPANDLPHAAGRAFYSSPIRLFDPETESPASFQTSFSFFFLNPSNITGSNSGGLSFIIAPDEFTLGRSGPWLAILNDACEENYKVFALEFDTLMNPEYGDPNDNHIGINLGSIVSTMTINVSDFGIRLNDGSVYRAWIVYNGNKKFMDIFLGPDGNISFAKPIYSGNVDLSKYLNEYMFVGFSASTGLNNTQVHSICSWNFTSVSQASLRTPSKKTCDSRIRIKSRRHHQHVHGKTPTSFLIFIAVVAFVLLLMISLFLIGKRRKKSSDDETVIVSDMMVHRPKPPNRARKFNFAEVSTATRDFDELQVLGSDGRGVTYRGAFINGCSVVVKRFSDQFLGSQPSNWARMRKEVKKMSKIRHPNLVPLKGWCFDNKRAIVVYDFIPNGSLDQWLSGFGVLPWTRRFKVVRDVAEALNYIHSKELAHKNVKGSSIFLDISFRAMLGDYGFVLSSIESARFEASVSQKVDVFEFGVLLLEIVSGRGRKPEPGEMELLNLAWAMHENDEKAKLVDPRMGSMVNRHQANRVLEVGLMCTLNDNKGRPSMEQVMEYINIENPFPGLPSNRPISLFPYTSTTGLCSGYTCTSIK